MISTGRENNPSGSPALDQLKSLTSNLNDAVQQYEDDLNSGKASPEDVSLAAQAIFEVTKTPEKQWINYAVRSAEAASIRCWMKWGVFDLIPMEGGISYSSLAEKVKAEEALIARMAGIMLSTGTLQKAGEDQIAHTRLSKVYTAGHPSGVMFQMLWDEANVPYAHWPEYFAQYGRIEPKGVSHNPFTVAHRRPEATYWEIREADPQRVKDFAQSMNVLEKLIPVTGVYDFSWIAQKAGESADRPLLVDVGGSKGQTIHAIVKENPGIPITRCVLQDRPEVVVHALPEIEGCKTMAHDFWKEQPVKGAVAYSIRRCLHDYHDDECVKILLNLADALAPDSKVLITEQILESPATPMAAQTDLCMLNLGGKERTEKNWHALAAASGLKINKISKNAMTKMGVIECVKA